MRQRGRTLREEGEGANDATIVEVQHERLTFVFLQFEFGLASNTLPPGMGRRTQLEDIEFARRYYKPATYRICER
jgi:hypothetical protein